MTTRANGAILPTLLVDCHGREHAFLRPAACLICRGTGTRPATPIEYLRCDNGHDLELLGTRTGWMLDGDRPEHTDEGGMMWTCTHGSGHADEPCGATVVLHYPETSTSPTPAETH